MKPKGAHRKMQRLMGTVLSLGDLLIDPAKARRRQQVEQWREWDQSQPSPDRSPAALRFSLQDTLMSAVIENDIASVSSALKEQHIDLSRVRTGNHGLSLLHQCAARNLVEMAGLLLAHGIDLEVTDVLGWTALHTAAAYGQREMLVVLLSRGADVLTCSYDGRVACEVVCSVSGEVGGKSALVLKDDITEVLWAHMRERGVDSAVKLAEYKQTAENDLIVHIKAIAATHRIVKGQNPANQPQDWIGRRLSASPNPDEQLAEKDENTPADELQPETHPLIQKPTSTAPDSSSPEPNPSVNGSVCECPPPDSNQPVSPNGYEDTCAHCSARRQSLSVALQAAEMPPDGVPPLPRTVSFALAGDGGKEVWEIDGELEDTGVTLLHLCAHRGWRRAGEVLLKLGADPNSRDADGWTPLHVAVYHNRPEFVRLLACNGADTSLRTADTHETIQDIAGNGGSARQGMKERRIRLLRYTRASQAEFSKGF